MYDKQSEYKLKSVSLSENDTFQMRSNSIIIDKYFDKMHGKCIIMYLEKEGEYV